VGFDRPQTRRLLFVDNVPSSALNARACLARPARLSGFRLTFPSRPQDSAFTRRGIYRSERVAITATVPGRRSRRKNMTRWPTARTASVAAKFIDEPRGCVAPFMALIHSPSVRSVGALVAPVPASVSTAAAIGRAAQLLKLRKGRRGSSVSSPIRGVSRQGCCGYFILLPASSALLSRLYLLCRRPATARSPGTRHVTPA